MSQRDGASSVQGRLMRVTPLNQDGSIDFTKPVFITRGFISASFSPEFEDGDEITEKAADGSVCISYKADDSLKRVNFNLSLCSPDPEAAAVIAGGLLLKSEEAGTAVPCGSANDEVIGYTSPAVGATVGNPIAVELWSTANVGGKPAVGTPWWHWVFPYVKVRYTGDREFGNAALSNEFEGQGLGNNALVPAGLAPAYPAPFPRLTQEDWVRFKAALTNPFSYVRSCDNLLGLNTDPAAPGAVQPGFYFGGGNATWDPSHVIKAGDLGIMSADPADAPFTVPGVNGADAASIAALNLALTAKAGYAWQLDDFIKVNGMDFYWSQTEGTWKPGHVPVPAVPATAVHKGSPGIFDPAGAVPPANLAALQADTGLAGLAAWADRRIGTVQEWIVLMDATSANWSGSAWVAVTEGQKNLDVTDLVSGGAAGWPGGKAPVDLAALKADGTVGDGDGFKADGALGAGAGVAFATGQYVVLGNNAKAHYDGNKWVAGVKP